MEKHVERIRKSLKESTAEEFEERVRQQTEFLKEEYRDGVFDNEDFSIGLELETYVVNEDGSVTALPGEFFANAPFSPELGVQNVELNTAPSRFDAGGVEEQERELTSLYSDTEAFLSDRNLLLVLDAIWTQYDGDSEAYLADFEDRDGFRFASNMREATRYHLLDNRLLDLREGRIALKVPGADRDFPSILFESLATSIQPHLQIPEADEFAKYFNIAIRTMAPLLALSTNSPFLPPELYNDVDDPHRLVEETLHELRIPIFEQSVNPGTEFEEKKVRFPEDLADTEDAFIKVKEDRCFDPCLQEWDKPAEREYRNRFWEWNYKRKTFWRWARPVVGGRAIEGVCGERSLRIEYRPLPTQPTLRDVFCLQMVTAGLVRGLSVEDHPLLQLDWEKARQSFYNAVDNGLAADMYWVNREGTMTRETAEIFEEVFDYAARGLRERGVPETAIERYMDPLKERWREKMTPSTWKKQKVRERLENGYSLGEAIQIMQQEYFETFREASSFTAAL